MGWGSASEYDFGNPLDPADTVEDTSHSEHSSSDDGNLDTADHPLLNLTLQPHRDWSGPGSNQGPPQCPVPPDPATRPPIPAETWWGALSNCPEAALRRALTPLEVEGGKLRRAADLVKDLLAMESKKAHIMYLLGRGQPLPFYPAYFPPGRRHLRGLNFVGGLRGQMAMTRHYLQLLTEATTRAYRELSTTDIRPDSKKEAISLAKFEWNVAQHDQQQR